MKTLFTFLGKYHFLFLFVLLEVFSVLFLVKNSYYQGSVILKSANEITGNVLDLYTNITDYFSLRKANYILAEENADLYNKLPESFITTDTNTFFLHDTLYRQQYKYVAAKLISYSTNRRNNYLMLNKGKVHGIAKEMAVITPGGIVGQVILVSDHYSRVMSVLNMHSKISVRLKSSMQIGTLTWNGENYRIGTMTDIPSHTKLIKGDTAITSGHSYIFPEGVNIGTVEDFRIRAGDNFYTADIKYAIDYNRMVYVYVVQNMQLNEVLELEAAENKYYVP